MALVRDGYTTLAYVADADGDQLLTIDVDGGRTRAITPLGGSPAQVLVLADGRVAVTLRDKNRVAILEPASIADDSLTTLCSVKTYAEPYGLALTPDDKRVLVTSAWAKKLAVYQAADMQLASHHDLGREPRDVLVDDAGKRAFVAHVVGGKLSVVDFDKKDDEVRTIDLREPKMMNFGGSADALRGSCQGFALAKSIEVQDAPMFDPEQPARELKITPKAPKGRVFAPRVTVEPGEPTQRSTGYGNARFARIEAPIASVIDSAAERNLTTALMPITSPGGKAPKGECLLPRAARVSSRSGGLLVACAGTDAVVEWDPRGTDPSRLERRRWQVPAGPTGVAVDEAGGRAVVWSQFDRQLAVIDLMGVSQSTVPVSAAPPLPKGKLDPKVAKGRKLFHKTDDPRISNDGRACASCHPDGREDALTWPTPVGPRQTIMLSGRVSGSAPFSWLGAHETIKVHLQTTFERLGGTGLADQPKRNDDELDALVAFVQKMPSPNLRDALVDEDKAAALDRGRALFHDGEQGCATCHVGGRGTDSNQHDLGTRGAGDNDAKFDTPSLRFVGGTAPYFHDGRFATLMDVLLASDSQMGHTLHLSRADAEALAAYMEML